MKKYPDVTELFRLKAEWRQQQAARPVTEKIETATRLRRLAQDMPKLTTGKTKSRTRNK